MRFKHIHIIATLFLIVGMGIQFVVSYQRETERVLERMDLEMQIAQEKLLFELYDAYETAGQIKYFMKNDMRKTEELLDETRTFMVRYPNFFTCYVAFAPYYYPKHGKWYALNSYRVHDSIITCTFGDANLDYFTREWYRGAEKSGEAGYWSQSYMDAEYSEPIFTYSDAIRDKEGNLWAVIGIDYSVSWLKRLLEQFKPFDEAVFALYSSNGRLLTSSENLPAVKDAQFDERKWVVSRQVLKPLNIGIVMAVPHRHVWESIWMVTLLPLGIFVLGIIVVALLFRRLIREEKVNARLGTEREVIARELQIANEIQQMMLPHQTVMGDGLRVTGFLKPAREVGGDLYDYFVRDEKLYFCIGDVSGKGAASAMLMAVTHSLFRSASAHENNPMHIMRAINESSAKDNDKNMFVTLFVGVLDLPTGLLRYCNAGHDEPFIVDGTKVERLCCDNNLPVGAFMDTPFTLQETKLEAGSMLFLYTDGLTEARNTKRQFFGLKRIEERLRGTADKVREPQQLIDAMLKSVHTFVGGAEQSDDLTMLAILYTPSTYNSKLSQSIVIKNRVSEMKRCSEFIKTVTEQLGIEPTLAGKLRLAVEEAVVNVIDYAYPMEINGKIEIGIQSDGETLRVIIRDSGVAFDPTAKEKTDVSLSAEERPIGGLGILLVRELMDSINYERINGENILTLTKKIK